MFGLFRPGLTVASLGGVALKLHSAAARVFMGNLCVREKTVDEFTLVVQERARK